MKGFLTGPCVLSAVIATVYSLYCLECFERDYQCRSYKKCKEGEVCLTSFENTMMPFWSGCWQSEYCNLNISFSTPDVRVRYATSCCNTDNCTAPTPTLMPNNAQKNGHTCPACYSQTKGDCIPQYSMACTGEEKSCIHLKSWGKYSRGCSTTDLCNITDILKPDNKRGHSCTRDNSISSLPVRNFLLCQTCLSKDGNCHYNRELCGLQEDVCVVEKIRTINDGQDTTEVIKRCGQAWECSRAGTLRSNYKKVVINTTCCSTDGCDAPVPTLPPLNSEPNGLTCPSCYVSNAKLCLQRRPLKCVGNESRCIHYTSTETFGTTVATESFHGCTTDSICKAGSLIRHFTSPETEAIRTIKMDLTCSKAMGLNNAVRSPLVSVIIGLRVINSIF
uniref:UPAR/Ly6 domain-containing protein n=1 Tax=Xenopus tropicalis TaxID=8364 RepID=A0A803JI26_XENTR